MQRYDEVLKQVEEEAKLLEKEWTLARSKKAVKALAGPGYAVAAALVSATIMGGFMPFLGWLIMKCMFGVTIASYEGRSGLDDIWPWLVCMFGCAVGGFFCKAISQIA